MSSEFSPMILGSKAEHQPSPNEGNLGVVVTSISEMANLLILLLEIVSSLIQSSHALRKT